MDTRQMLKDIARETREAINQQPARVAIRRLPAKHQALFRRRIALQKEMTAVDSAIVRAGYHTHNIHSTSVQPVSRHVDDRRRQLNVAQRECELALMAATTGPKRAEAVRKFIIIAKGLSK
jgi:hypothetical protein